MIFSLGPFIRSCDFLQFALFAILQNYASIVLVVYYWRMALEDQFLDRHPYGGLMIPPRTFVDVSWSD